MSVLVQIAKNSYKRDGERLMRVLFFSGLILAAILFVGCSDENTDDTGDSGAVDSAVEETE